jgi:hypothetical protein
LTGISKPLTAYIITWSETIYEMFLLIGRFPRLTGSNPTKDGGFLRAIKISSTPSFVGEVKPSAPCRKIFTACYRTLRSMKENISSANFTAISPEVSPDSLSYVCWYLPESSGGRIRND